MFLCASQTTAKSKRPKQTNKTRCTFEAYPMETLTKKTKHTNSQTAVLNVKRKTKTAATAKQTTTNLRHKGKAY